MDLFKMMGKARELQSRMGEMQDELKSIEVTGESGAGSVVAKVNGQFELISLTIEPSMLKPEEAEIVEDLVIAAVADARNKAQTEIQAKTQEMMGDLQLPPGLKLPFG